MSSVLGRLMNTYVDKTGLLVGSWFSGITFGIEALQLYQYLASFPEDHAFLKLSVLFLFCVDIAANILFYVATHRQLIAVKLGSMEEIIPSLTLVCLPFLACTTVAGVNIFLVWRYHRLTKRLWLCICLYAIIGAAFACHVWATSHSLKFRDFGISDLVNLDKSLEQANNAAKAGLAMEVSLVCLIWLLLLVQLLSLLRRDMQSARRIIVRLLLVTLESGTVASGVSIASLAYYMCNMPYSNLIVMVTFMARIYFMNMLFNLNVRKSGHIMRDISSHGHSHSHRPTGSYTDSNSLPLSTLRSSPGDSQFNHSIIHVSRSVETKVDKHEHDSQPETV